jgi:hypothetical protein
VDHALRVRRQAGQRCARGPLGTRLNLFSATWGCLQRGREKRGDWDRIG